MEIIDSVSQEERFLMAISNPIVFGEYYIKPFTRKWDTKTADFQYDMIDHVLRYHNVVIHIPVEHAKSTWISLVYPLWYLANNKNDSILLISNTARQAIAFLSVIKLHLEYNEMLKADFPYLVPDYNRKWTESQIYIKRDMEEQSKDPSIMAIGTEGAVLGARINCVIADDILDLKNTKTDRLRDSVRDWWQEIINSRVGEEGKKIMLGTLQHDKDLLCEMSDKTSVYKYVHYKGLDFSTDPPTPLWADKWSLERLLLKREDIGIIKFNKVIQNDRSSFRVKILDLKWLNYYGNIHKIQLPYDFEMDYYIGFDPAIADDKQSAEEKGQDKCCIAVHGLCRKTKRIFLISYVHDWFTFPEQLDLIDKTYKMYAHACKGVGIESNAYQRALAQQAFLLKTLPPIIQVNAKQSKSARIELFGVYSYSKRYYIREDFDEFIEQWKDFEPGGTSPNILDACSIATALISGIGVINSNEKNLVQKISI